MDELKRLRANALLDLHYFSGLSHDPGVRGKIVTNDRKIYRYFEGDAETIVYKPRKFKRRGYNELIKYIEENILEKEFAKNFIFDVTYYVDVFYNGDFFEIVNNYDLFDDLDKIIDKYTKKGMFE